MNYVVREMKAADLEPVLELWGSTEGLYPDDSDTTANMSRYLDRNAGLCFVALREDEIIGAVKCGQDGRRGYLHHLAVRKDCRKHGVGQALVHAVLRALHRQGIEKCNTFVLNENDEARAFWEHNGWIALEYYYRTLQKETASE